MSAGEVVNRSWGVLAHSTGGSDQITLSEAIAQEQEYLGTFCFEGQESIVDAWSNVIENDGGVPTSRLVALAALPSEIAADGAQTAQQLQEKDTLLREIQHRVKNNLQMITALIRMEARQVPEAGEPFNRLAGRIEALSLLYASKLVLATSRHPWCAMRKDQ